MNKNDVLRKIKESGIVPVVRADSYVEAEEIVDRLSTDGFKIFEITMTVPDGANLIKKLITRLGNEALVGAGTVLDVEKAQKCIEAGAAFIVTPCLNLDVIEICRIRDVLVCAGALTPTEIYAAWTAGADVVKVFPVSAMGGANYIKSLKGPFPDIQLIPTGGLKKENLSEQKEAGAIAIGVSAKALK